MLAAGTTVCPLVLTCFLQLHAPDEGAVETQARRRRRGVKYPILRAPSYITSAFAPLHVTIRTGRLVCVVWSGDSLLAITAGRSSPPELERNVSPNIVSLLRLQPAPYTLRPVSRSQRPISFWTRAMTSSSELALPNASTNCPFGSMK